MPTPTITVTQAREDFAELVNRVAYGHERVSVARRGRELVAVVPASDLVLLRLIEDELDLISARAALADPENAVALDWNDVADDLD